MWALTLAVALTCLAIATRVAVYMHRIVQHAADCDITTCAARLPWTGRTRDGRWVLRRRP